MKRRDLIVPATGGVLTLGLAGALMADVSPQAEDVHPYLGLRWDDLRFPATGISVGGFASPPDVETDTGLLLFDGTTTVESVGIIAQMPHSWREGSEVKPHVHWNKTTDAAGGVLWTLRYKILEIGEVETAWSDTISATLVPALDPGSTQAHAISEFPAIDMSGYHLSDMILVQLGRLYSDPSDTYEADVRLLEFDIHYQIDSHGSREEYVK